MGRVRSNIGRKIGSINEMLKAFEEMPDVVTKRLHQELITYELDGHDINRVEGHLVGSFGVEKLSGSVWALKQVNAQAPYAKTVMTWVSRARSGKFSMDLLRERMMPYIEKEILKEFQKMDDKANSRDGYKWQIKNFLP